MTGGNPKGKSSSSSRKSKWGSADNNKRNSNFITINPSASASASSPKPTTTTTSNPPSSSTPKSDPSSKPGPSRPQPDPSGPGLLPPPGSTPPFSLPEHGAPPTGPNGPIGSDPAGFGLGLPPQSSYGFHMLERRTFFLADGSVRSYFALPADYQDFPVPPQNRPIDDRFLPFGPGGGGPPRDMDGGRLGFENHFPPVGRLSPETAFRRDRERELERREEIFGRGGGPGAGGGQSDYWSSLGLDGRQEGSLKRKYGDGDERDGRDGRDMRDGRDPRDSRGEELARQRQQLLQWGNSSSEQNGFPGSTERGSFFGGTSSHFQRDMLESGRGGEDMRLSKHMRGGGDYDLGGRDSGAKDADLDPQALKNAFTKYVRSINEDGAQKKKYLDDGKSGSLQCLACGRASKDFSDMHGLIVHAYNSHSADLHSDHRGLHKALCVLMGWSYTKVPDNSKAYRSLSADEAEANKDDLILWPPVVVIHNTNTGKGKEGRAEGLGNKVMDNKLKDLGFTGGKSKSLYGKEGHLGITLVKFAGNQSGLKDAARLGDYFEKENHGRKGWARAQSSQSGRDDESNPNLVKVDEKTGEKKRIFYGYLATAADLEEVDADTRKKAVIESKKEFKA